MERIRSSVLAEPSPATQKAILALWSTFAAIVGVSPEAKKVVGCENIPNSVHIVAINHTGIFDAPAVMYAWRRFTGKWVHFVAKSETFDMPIVGDLCKAAQWIPVVRGQADMFAIRSAVSHLKAGHIVGIMPEGTRNRGGNSSLNIFREGVSLIGKLAGEVPIVPVGVTGPENILPLIEEMEPSRIVSEVIKLRIQKIKPTISIVIGKPITDYGSDRTSTTRLIRESIEELLI